MKLHRIVAMSLLFTLPLSAVTMPAQYDVCVYGATSAGIVAAVQARRMGKTVVVVEPGKHIGGLTTGGLGATDIGNKGAVGGISRDFYHRIAQYYSRSNAWVWERREDYFLKRGSSQSAASELESPESTMWTFEPHVAELVYKQMLKDAEVPVILEHRLDSVHKKQGRIIDIVAGQGTIYQAQMFIDATYEGDLMAMAGVKYTVGREANSKYGETLDGIRPKTPHHQFVVPVDPYIQPGRVSSGLLPHVQPGGLGKAEKGDRCVQAYNYRLCFTTNEANRLPLEPPADYNPANYELLARYLEGLVAADKKPKLSDFWNPIWMPNMKTDINNNGGFSTDYIGMNYRYPEGDDSLRQSIAQAHENYTRGFLVFLATSPRVPENIRLEMKKWGPCKDEFQETGGWPRQLYVREARRMVSDCVMTEKHCRYRETVADSVGLAAYNMDSHNCRRIVRDGHAENEGDVQVAPMSPYPISYRAIIPKASQCSNLLVPVCLSASHIAYGSIRMEPVFMILGQSAATAAAFAIDDHVSLQNLDYTKLRARLLADGQRLTWQPVKP